MVDECPSWMPVRGLVVSFGLLMAAEELTAVTLLGILFFHEAYEVVDGPALLVVMMIFQLVNLVVLGVNWRNSLRKARSVAVDVGLSLLASITLTIMIGILLPRIHIEPRTSRLPVVVVTIWFCYAGIVFREIAVAGLTTWWLVLCTQDSQV